MNTSTPESILLLSELIKTTNKLGFIPISKRFNVTQIAEYINQHNDYINTSRNVEKFTKNYVTTSMYDIGISPANLIESQQAMDSIKDPLTDVANNTIKAKQEAKNSNNPADYTTNIRGFI